MYSRTGTHPGHLTDPGSPLDVPVAPAPTPPPGAAGDNRSRLPTTGLDVSGVVTLGVAMVLAGVLMLTVRRRGPRSTLAPLPPDDDYTWHAPTQELPIWNRSTSD
ncbi:MAG TPA: hypothetical protein VK028_15105 [Micromonosporaceae bacterium]|nr:hypothetical protein [Micromonosporaceae bacterium]